MSAYAPEDGSDLLATASRVSAALAGVSTLRRQDVAAWPRTATFPRAGLAG